MSEYKLGWHRGKLVAVWYENGERRRHSLRTTDKAIADAALAEFARTHRLASSGTPVTVGAIYQAYMADRAEDGKPTVRMQDAWKRLSPTFGSLLPRSITKAICKAYIANRTAKGGDSASRGTVHLEMTYLRAALNFASRKGWIDKPPIVTVPTRPRPRHYHLTRDEANKVLEAAVMPHVRLFIILALTTAGRATSLLELRWSRVNFKRGEIDLRDLERDETPKGRALVPMNDTARAALEEAKRKALSPFVVEWGGEQVRSIKKGIAAASGRAKIKVTPHVLRHTAAVWMAEGGTAIEEIAQYLGHNNPATTFRVYARYSPGHLKKASKNLDL